MRSEKVQARHKKINEHRIQDTTVQMLYTGVFEVMKLSQILYLAVMNIDCIKFNGLSIACISFCTKLFSKSSLLIILIRTGMVTLSEGIKLFFECKAMVEPSVHLTDWKYCLIYVDPISTF